MKTLRIAIDARPLAFPMVGITRYTHEVLSRLVHFPHEWYLYLDREPVHPIPDLPNVHICYGSAQRAASSTLFAQLVFSFWARRDKIDVFWSPRHHLPLLLPSKMKKLLTVHDMVWLHHPETMSKAGRWVERLLMPPALNAAQKIMTVSDATKKDVKAYSSRCSSKLITIYPGLTHTEANESLDEGVTRPYYLFVGTLEPRKNLPNLLKAFSLLCKSNQEISLVIVGGQGWGNEALASLILDLELKTRVMLVGRVSEQELASYYANATALLMPSFYEGFGLPLLEAMGHGVPIISTNTGAMAEVTDGAGFLIDPTSTDDLAEAMLNMLIPEVHSRFSIKALERSRDFSWDDTVRKVLTEIESLIR